MIVFARVAEHGSFSAAARELRMSRSAVSIAVSSLEEAMGVSLLRRSTRKVALTRIGASFLSECAAVRETASAALLAANAASERVAGRLRVRSPGGIVGERIVVPALAELTRAHGVELELDCSDDRTDPIAGEVDAVIRLGAARDSALVMRRVGRTPDVVVATPALARGLEDPAQLRERPWIVHRAFPRRVTIGRKGSRRSSITMRVVAEVNDSSALLGLALRGVGLAIMPRAALRPELASGRLVEPFPDAPVRTAQFFVLLPSRRIPQRVRLMITLLARQLEAR